MRLKRKLYLKFILLKLHLAYLIFRCEKIYKVLYNLFCIAGLGFYMWELDRLSNIKVMPIVMIGILSYLVTMIIIGLYIITFFDFKWELYRSLSLTHNTHLRGHGYISESELNYLHRKDSWLRKTWG